ncbi:hypothetical protein [Paenibacillus puerhi]|uniref:hypothetical protein n=1 Tax=Paenibacillus puerhi TaxID=2692622 RepID=UPI001356C568|nr:hypothetical protein [Paenibacillus puerhi]
MKKRQALYLTGCWIFLSLTLITGCGQQQKSGQEMQGKGKQQNDKPIDTQLQQQFKMYQEIQQQEFETEEKKRASEKKQLKKLQETQAKSLKQEFKYQRMLQHSGNPWKQQDKQAPEEGQKSGSKDSEGSGGKAKKQEHPPKEAKKSE